MSDLTARTVEPDPRPRVQVWRCDITPARAGVNGLHRHLRAPPGALLALEASTEGVGPLRHTVGWLLVGRPVSRVLDAAGWVEVTRCAHDGTPNAGSALYGAAARWARKEGKPILTYTLPSESGASLRGAGWVPVGTTRKGQWSTPSRLRAAGPLDGIAKVRWVPPWCVDRVDW